MIVDQAYRRVLRPVLFRAGSGDPERVHEQTLAALGRLGGKPAALAAIRALCAGPRRPVRVAGVTFPALVGLAAGMDKDGVALPAWAALSWARATHPASGVSPPSTPPLGLRLREASMRGYAVLPEERAAG